MYINGYFDWNADGDWDDKGEFVIGNLPGVCPGTLASPAVCVVGAGPVVCNVKAPKGAVSGGYARFRLDWGEDVGFVGGIDPTLRPPPGELVPRRARGAAQFGEVEDYRMLICLDEPLEVGPVKPEKGTPDSGGGRGAQVLVGRIPHVGRVISGTAVGSEGGKAGASRAAGELALGDACSCDQDCAAAGDDCNIVQCIVRSICINDPTVPCASDEDCEAASAGTCLSGLELQLCALVQLIDWPCDTDGDFCTEDRCEDDGTETFKSVCMAQDDGSGQPLSPCAKKCMGGPNDGLVCDQASDCEEGACRIASGGLCDDATDACYVGPSVVGAIGRCCTAGSCTETDEVTCAIGGGAWYRYRSPDQMKGDENCLCPKYGSGVAPPGDDLGSIGLVRPSGLICLVGSDVSIADGCGPVYCEDLDGDGFAPEFCQKRCVGGDNQGATCAVDFPDCALLGLCSQTGHCCSPAQGGADCPDPPAGQICIPTNPGTCVQDACGTNDIEGGCEDGFLSIGDDYVVENGSFLRLSQFRFRGGISNLGEDVVIEFWDATGTMLIDSFEVNDLRQIGTHDWTIQVDCWPNCNATQLEIPEQSPIIIPPTGYVVMRSPRTIGTISGAAAFWSQTDNPADVGLNDNTKAWVNGDPNSSLGTNVFIFELVGSKVPEPLGACCDDAESCEDTLRWECGLCSETETPVLCADTLHDCPEGGLGGSTCQFDNWFGPISHDDFESGSPNLTLCNGIEPCDMGGCCDGFGNCTVKTKDQCVNMLGDDWLGSGTDCSEDCPPIGACCQDGEICDELTDIECGEEGGLFLGDDTVCDQNCPSLIGACCEENDACTELNETECRAACGTFQGIGTNCAQECLGACCKDNDDRTQSHGNECVAPDESFKGVGTICEEECPTIGACCQDPDVCTALNAADCAAVGGTFKGAGTVCNPDCPVLDPPIRAPAPHDILKNRYISVDPRGASGTNPDSHHIKVEVVSSLVNGQVGSGPWWAGPPGPAMDLCQTPCISVVTTTKPVSEPDWSACPVLHLTGCPIIPTTTYALSAESGSQSSAVNQLDTQAKPGIKWCGDCVGFFTGTEWTGPNGQTSIDDAVAAIKTFQNPCNLPGCGTPPCNAVHVSVCDVSPNQNGAEINLIVNIEDVLGIILCFRGFEYPGGDLTLCE